MIGTELGGRYRIEAKLGEGGVGTVYRAVHLADGLAVAVKVLRPELSSSVELRQRFERETRALASLSHPNIVAIIDSGVSDSVAYLVMNLLTGETLSDRLKRGPIAASEATGILRELLSALAFVHERGLVHRDVKPANVFLESGAGAARVRLLDFGLARFLNPEDGGRALTRAGQVFGTPSYMAPEQVAGQVADPRADVYAVAIVFFEMLAGHPPFRGEPSEVLRQQVMDDLPIEKGLPPAIVPAEVLEVLRRAGQKARAERYVNGSEMLAALDAATARSKASEEAATVLDADSKDLPELEGSAVEMLDPDWGADDADAPQPGRAPRTAFRAVAILATVISLSVLAAAAAGVHVFVTPELAPRRYALESALGLSHVKTRTLVPQSSASATADPVAPPTHSAAAMPPPSAPLLPPAPAATQEDVAPASSPAPPTSAEPALPVPADASRPQATNPWSSTPAELARLVPKASRPKGFEKREVLQLHQYNGRHPDDPRGHLLLARSYATRRWFKDALSEYAIALKIDDDARGDPRMLRDLITLVQFGSLEAARMVVEVFGKTAVPAVDKALASGRLTTPQSKAALENLRNDLSP